MVYIVSGYIFFYQKQVPVQQFGEEDTSCSSFSVLTLNYYSVHYAMSSSNIRLRVDTDRKECKVQGGFQIIFGKWEQIKESNDPFMLGSLMALFTLGFGFGYYHSHLKFQKLGGKK